MVVKRVVILITLLIILSVFPACEGAGTEQVSWVDATFTFTFLNGTHLRMHLILDVHNLTVYGMIYGADEIRESYDSEGGAFRSRIFDLSMDILNRVFENCKISLDIPKEDPSTLTAPRDNDPFNPPVRFLMDGNLTLSKEFFGTDIEMIDDFIDGLLDIGSRIRYDFSFLAPAHWNITYIFRFPNNLSISEVGKGEVSIDGKEVSWCIENWKEGKEEWEEGYLKIEKTNPTFTSTEEALRANLSFDLSSIDYTLLNVSLEIYSLDLSNIVSLPDFVEGVKVLPSDGIRLLQSAGSISDDDLEQVFKEKWSMLVSDLRLALNKNLSLSMDLDPDTMINCSSPYNSSHMDQYPPIVLSGNDTLIYFLGNYSTRSLMGIVYSGGRINLNEKILNLSGLRYPFEARVILPYGEIIRWNNSEELNVTILKEDARSYGEERIERRVDIEIKSIDLDLLSLFTGRSRVVSGIDVRDNLMIYRIDSSKILDLPSWIELDKMVSDLIRLSLEEEMSGERMDEFIGLRKNLSRELVSSLAGHDEVRIFFDEGAFRESLEWDGRVDGMDDTNPIVISFFSSITRGTGFSLSLLPPTFKVMNESFNCASIPNENVTYRFIFPKGVDVTFKDSLGIAREGELEDGRKYIEIAFVKDGNLLSTTIYYSMKLPSLMVLKVFLPLIIMAVIIIFIVSLIIFMRKRYRMRPRKPAIEEFSKEETDDLGQER